MPLNMYNSTHYPLYKALFTRSDDNVIDPSEVPFWVSAQTMDQYFQVSTVAVLVYDARKWKL